MRRIMAQDCMYIHCCTRYILVRHTKGSTTLKILYFNDFRLGVLNGQNAVDVMDVVKDIPHTGPHNLINGLIGRFGDYRGKLDPAAAKGKGVPLAEVRIRPPLPKPHNIDC